MDEIGLSVLVYCAFAEHWTFGLIYVYLSYDMDGASVFPLFSPETEIVDIFKIDKYYDAPYNYSVTI